MASISSWLLLAAGAGVAGGDAGSRLCGGPLRRRDRRRRNIPHRRPGPRRCRRLFRYRRRGGFLCSRRLRLVVGNDPTDRRQNLLHRGLLDLCRLRHLQLHIETNLHQATRDSLVPDMQAGIFIASSPTCPQIKRRPMDRARLCFPSWQRMRSQRDKKWRESLCCPRKRYVIATIDCKQAPVILRTTSYVSCQARLLHAGRHAPRDRSTVRPFARKRFRASDANATLSDRQACARPSSCHAPAGNARSHHTSWWTSLSTCGDSRPTALSTA